MGLPIAGFQTLISILSIPVSEDPLVQIVEENWEILSTASSPDSLKVVRSVLETLGKLSTLQGYSDQDVWNAIHAKRNHAESDESDSADEDDLKRPEWRVFSSPRQGSKTS